jgi:hypothetical protein
LVFYIRLATGSDIAIDAPCQPSDNAATTPVIM